MAKAAGLREPALFRFHGDAIEASVAVGHKDQALALLEDLADAAQLLVAADDGLHPAGDYA